MEHMCAGNGHPRPFTLYLTRLKLTIKFKCANVCVHTNKIRTISTGQDILFLIQKNGIIFFFGCHFTHLASFKRSIILCPTDFCLRYWTVNLTVDAVLNFGGEMFRFWCNVNRSRFHCVKRETEREKMIRKSLKRDKKRVKCKKKSMAYNSMITNFKVKQNQVILKNAPIAHIACTFHFCNHFVVINVEKRYCMYCVQHFFQRSGKMFTVVSIFSSSDCAFVLVACVVSAFIDIDSTWLCWQNKTCN